MTVDLASGPEVTAAQLANDTEGEPDPAPSVGRKRKISMKKREKRKIKRKLEKMEERDGPDVRDSAKDKYEASSVPICTNANVSEAKVASMGYIGLNPRDKRRDERRDEQCDEQHDEQCDEQRDEPLRVFTLHELLHKKKFVRLRWDGRYDFFFLSFMPYSC